MAMLHLQRVHFAFDSHRLTSASRQSLASAGALLSRYPDVQVSIDGHADQRGPAGYNYVLGRRRAETVAALLASQGVPRVRLAVESFGETQPADAGRGRLAYARNRRVEFRLLKGGAELRLEEGQLLDDRGRPLAERGEPRQPPRRHRGALARK